MTGPERQEHPSDSPATDRDVRTLAPSGELGTYRAMVRLDGPEVVDIEFKDGVLTYNGHEIRLETLIRLGERIADGVQCVLRARLEGAQQGTLLRMRLPWTPALPEINVPEIQFKPGDVELA